MYTEQQAREAIGAKQVEELNKQFQLIVHNTAVREQHIYNLPYRILFDYFSNSDRDIMDIPINPFYPFPGMLKTSENEKPCTGRPTAWNLDTEKGQQAWLYHFMVFIMPYKEKIPNFSKFDMYGSVTATDQELKKRKRYYMDLIKKCIEHPDLYSHEVAHKDITDYDKYYLGTSIIFGYMWYDDISKEPTPPNTDRDTALAIMYKERERQQEYYGLEEYNLESKDNYSMCYRIEKIIEQLESGTDQEE